MPKKPKIDQADIDYFHKAMEGTVPLQHAKIRVPKKPVVKNPVPFKTKPEESFQFNDVDIFNEVSGEEFISFHQPGMPNKTLRKLRKGQYNVEAILDLHGLSVDEARIAVDLFLQECLLKGIRVLLIIHGKGYHSQGPVLKNKLNQWLRTTKVILAFCSAAPAHGSRGAIYVLLKNNSEEGLI